MDTKIPPPLVALITLGLMWALNRSVRIHVDLDEIPDTAPKVLFGLLLTAAILLTASAIRGFRAAKTTVTPLQPDKASTLVVSGPYTFTRNPMYLGLLCLLLAATTWFGNFALLALCAAFVWYITAFQIKPEETALRDRFGADFDAYCKRVRRWI